MSTQLSTTEQLPAPLFTPTPKAAKRMLEFFTAQINNPHTRRAYLNASRRFATWCQDHRIGQLAEVQPVHVAAFIQHLQGQLAPATVKQHLAALRVLFDWLVTGQVLQLNPAHSVRGPKYSLKKGKTPVLTAEEARALLDSIRTVRTVQHGDGTETEKPLGEPLLLGLRDRALIGTMVYSFARVSAVLRMRVRDYFVRGRRAVGSGCTRRAARSMQSPVITTWSCISTPTSPPLALPRTSTRRFSGRRPAAPGCSPPIPCGSKTPTA